MYQPYIDPNSVVHRPSLPYFGSVYGGVNVGTLILVYGKVPFNANRFDINFLIGSVVNEKTKSEGDIAFHFNPRLDEQVVVRNSRKNGIWETEEREPRSLPFQRSNEFTVMILVEDSGYKVAINGKHFIDFRHRMPLPSVGIFNVNGEVVIDRIEYRRESRYAQQPYMPSAAAAYMPSPAERFMPTTATPYMPATAATPNAPPVAPQPYVPVSVSYNLNPVFNPPVPYMHYFSNGLPVGLMVYLSGRLNPNPTGFTIDFYSEKAPQSDLAFHFNVRSRNSEVVRNSCINNSWHKEEREIPNYPFTAGINFDMIIRVESERYLVAVNGQHFIHFSHRIPHNLVNKLHIHGEISITSIRFAQS